MIRALGETEIEGFETTIPLFEWILDEERFNEGDFHTGYLEEADWEEDLREETV